MIRFKPLKLSCEQSLNIHRVLVPEDIKNGTQRNLDEVVLAHSTAVEYPDSRGGCIVKSDLVISKLM